MRRSRVPDAIVVVDELPHTATGKLNKLPLRAQWQDHLMQLGGGPE
jgi:acyl-coenzyme A synthetase/AMP-(fatty) acid ligase